MVEISPPKVNVSEESIGVQTMYPSERFWTDDDEERANREALIAERVPKNPDVVVVHDRDADGLGSAVMARLESPDAALVPRGHSGNISVGEIGEMLSDHIETGGRVLITDNGLTVGRDQTASEAMEKYLSPYIQIFDEVIVYDHHDWDEDALIWMEQFRKETHVEYVIDSDRCATQIVHDEYVSECSEEYSELAEITNDHDLYIKDDPRSDALADYVFGVDEMTYIETALAHGSKLLDRDDVQTIISDVRERTEQELAIGIERATFHELNDKTLAITYGNLPRSELGARLYENHGADVVCIMQPSGGLSFRSNDDGSALAMAKAFGGGGHNDAAGGYLKDTNTGAIPYSSYWGTLGRVAENMLLSRGRLALRLADAEAVIETLQDDVEVAKELLVHNSLTSSPV